jgi:aspartyl-tRNA(Asn)/glutamyl-tRNA(Gln) amidotransferase subunit A
MNAVDAKVDKIKLIVLDKYFDNCDSDLKLMYDQSIRFLARSTSLYKIEMPPKFDNVTEYYLTILENEARANHIDRMERRPDEYPLKIRELINGTLRPSHLLPTAREERTTLRDFFKLFFKPRAALITPATTSFAPTPETTGSPAFNSPWSFLRFPVVSVPAGWSDDGLPMAVQLIGKHDGDSQLLAVASRVESQLNMTSRLPPVPQ